MKRLVCLFALLSAPVFAQTRGNLFSTQAIQEFGQALTSSSHFGIPRLASDPTCDVTMEGRLWENTTSHTVKGCLNGSVTAVGSSSASFDTITGGTNTTAAMIVGTGGSISTTGTGAITATSLAASVNAQTGTTYTTTAGDSNGAVTITNAGNSGSLAVTLINDPPAGTRQRVCVAAAQAVSVAPNTGESLYFNGTTASSISCSTIGCCVDVVAAVGGSGGVWIASTYTGPLS